MITASIVSALRSSSEHKFVAGVVGHWEAMKEMSAVLRDAADIDDGFPW